MNLLKARAVLNLPDNYTESDIKKNYRLLIMKYHPDKCKDPDSSGKFIEVQEAYNFLSKEAPEVDIFNIVNIFFKKMSSQKTKQSEKIKLKLIVKDYFTGVEKVLKVKGNCKCNNDLCVSCVGTGYNLNTLSVCMDCLGNGFLCDCYYDLTVNLPKQFGNQQKFEIIFEDLGNYYFENGKIYYRFEISLKESLIGFEKVFKDPFEIHHLISANQIIKPGDGYSVKVNGCELILVFDVIYPKKLSSDLKKTIGDLM